jgi:hypothetical protein
MPTQNNAGQSAAIVEYKLVQLYTFTLASGALLSQNLPSQMLWYGLQIDLVGTVNISVAVPTEALDGALNLVQQMTLNLNGRPIINGGLVDFFYRSWYDQQCKPLATDPGTATGDFGYSFRIWFNLPFPAKAPGSYGTAVPAALINNIQMLVQCPSSLAAAQFSNINGATITYSNGPSLLISALAADIDRPTMINIVNAGGHGYVQNQYLQPLAAAGNNDLELQGGSGVLKDIYCDTVNNSVHQTFAAAPFISNVQTLVGNNLYPLDTTWNSLQQQATQQYGIASAQIPPGTWRYTFNPHGDFMEGIDLRRQPSVKLRSNVTTTPTATSKNTVITGILVPGYIKSIL